MWSPRPSISRLRRQAGFTLIELMIGVLIGLLASLAVTHVLVNSEGQKRSTTSGSDAQVNGALALNTMQRTVQPAGYGFTAVPSLIGCTLTGTFSGNSVTSTLASFPTVLAPVTIVDGAAGAPDSVRVLSSGTASFSIPIRMVAPGYVAGGATFPVTSVRGIAAGDLMVAANSAATPPTSACEIFQVTANPGSVPTVARVDNAWNGTTTPPASYGDGAVLVNLGAPSDITYSIVNNALVMRSLKIGTDANSTPSYPAAVEVFPNIVQMQALYGKDTDANGTVDTWNNTTPTDNDGWKQVIAVRIAVVARSAQYERQDPTNGTYVTNANISWDVGNAGTVAGSAVCGTPASKCLTIKIDDLTDWQNYRYKLFETVIPLRNMLWNS
jgi:type IV pilus assembly protein PilW